MLANEIYAAYLFYYFLYNLKINFICFDKKIWLGLKMESRIRICNEAIQIRKKLFRAESKTLTGLLGKYGTLCTHAKKKTFSCAFGAVVFMKKKTLWDFVISSLNRCTVPVRKGELDPTQILQSFPGMCDAIRTRIWAFWGRIYNWSRTLKGLSHEIDFKNVDENGQIFALIRAAAGFWIFRRHLWFLVEIKHILSGKC